MSPVARSGRQGKERLFPDILREQGTDETAEIVKRSATKSPQASMLVLIVMLKQLLHHLSTPDPRTGNSGRRP